MKNNPVAITSILIFVVLANFWRAVWPSMLAARQIFDGLFLPISIFIILGLILYSFVYGMKRTRMVQLYSELSVFLGSDLIVTSFPSFISCGLPVPGHPVNCAPFIIYTLTTTSFRFAGVLLLVSGIIGSVYYLEHPTMKEPRREVPARQLISNNMPLGNSPISIRLFCQRCGEHLTQEALFCGGCGNPVERQIQSGQNIQQLVPLPPKPWLMNALNSGSYRRLPNPFSMGFLSGLLISLLDFFLLFYGFSIVALDGLASIVLWFLGPWIVVPIAVGIFSESRYDTRAGLGRFVLGEGLTFILSSIALFFLIALAAVFQAAASGQFVPIPP